jgi:hypothetical protein
MTWPKPEPAKVWEAIDAYLLRAYPGGKAPSAVAQRLETLRSAPPESFFDSAVFERGDGADPMSGPNRFALRLGNRAYPHMKLVIERSPDGKAHLFRADTHDRHIRPKPDSREYAAFTELMKMNQSLAEQIEGDWAQRGLNTFKSYLRRDLAARQQHQEPASPASQASPPAGDASPGPA